MSGNRRTIIKCLGLIFIASALRLLWLGDMEFKSDERFISEYLRTLGDRVFTVATPPAGNSGVTLSNGFYYFLNALPLKYVSPLIVVWAIAGLNALAVALGLWFLRHSRTGFLTFALIGSSVTLIQGSRKIWFPDLVPFWINLGLALFLVSTLVRVRLKKNLLVAAAAFCFGIAGHMYMPGLMIGLCVSGAALLSFFLCRDWSGLKSWLAGLLVAGLSWIPYLIFMLSGKGAYGRAGGLPEIQWKSLLTLFRHSLTFPSVFPFYSQYIKKIHEGIHPLTGSTVLLEVVRGGLIAAGTLGILSYWGAVFVLFRSQKSKAPSALKADPMLLSWAVLLVLVPLALFVTQLGSYLHYWLGIIPFGFYLISWAAYRDEDPQWSQWIRRFAWGSCSASAAAALAFAVLVHLNRGLPGDYGPAYSASQAVLGDG